MPQLNQRFLFAAMAAAAAWLAPMAAHACTTSTTSIDLGAHSSFAVATDPLSASGSAGLQCDILLAALTPHYVALEVDASTFLLTGPDGDQIAYSAALTPNGAPLAVGNFQNLSSFSLVSLFSGTNSSIPIYIRTAATPALRAGTYSGHIDIRWFYSVCSLGVLLCLAHSESPGFVRPILLTPLDWGAGTAVRVNVELEVEQDCIITAPDLDFGQAPLAGSFSPVTRTILIRCSAGAAYTVGLDDGAHASGGVRRMQSGADHLQYEIYKSVASPDRWGAIGGARRGSESADSGAGVYDSVTTQGFGYRAEVLPGQATPPPGSYSDTIRIDIAF
jgi:spore coat protein U-like protein